MIKNIILIIGVLNICGCSTWLRYNWEEAQKLLPKNSVVIKITNDYIEYSNTNGVYQAYYVSDGSQIYQYKKIK